MKREKKSKTSTDTPGLAVLVADADRRTQKDCGEIVESLGYRAILVGSLAEAAKSLELEPIEIVLADIRLSTNGADVVAALKRANPKAEIAILSPSADVPRALQAVKHGAADYVLKPATHEGIRLVLQRLQDAVRLKDENELLREKVSSLGHFGLMVGPSAQMQQVFRLIHKFASSKLPVLIAGENGTGKETTARTIHELGARTEPFVPFDCEAYSNRPAAAESALFGDAKNKGTLKTAGEGTVFLNEVASLTPDIQTRLLRVLNEREFRPDGASKAEPFDARVMAATSRDIKEAVQKGEFRKDLYFRLNVASLFLPPLRERRSDIPMLGETVLERIASSPNGRRMEAPWRLSSDVLDLFLRYDWPANIEEFKSALEHAVSVASGPLIRLSDLPSSLQSFSQSQAERKPETVIPLEEMEREAVRRALEISGGDTRRAAKLLGIAESSLSRKIKKYQNS